MTSVPSIEQILEKYEGQHIKADNDEQLEQYFVFKGKLHYIDIGAAQVCEKCELVPQHLDLEEEIILTQAPRGGGYNALQMEKILDNLSITVPTGTEDPLVELQKFKDLVERQTCRDIYVDGKPQENVARGLLQSFLGRRSYREVPVKGGRSDILVFTREGRFLYETKIWRGQKYYHQGLGELDEYIQGENDDNQLKRVFFIIFDPTKTKCAGSQRIETLRACKVDVIVIHISPAIPSKKQYENHRSSNRVRDGN